ncbi:Solute carrier organic anion transporter family member 2B1 [Liparis tanakae]|uniref:Solute carrier organic anion transporter family member 2B1 n=1 Tax=Liparis tanakae TaxID=230148 RepID=A0A4Z2G1N3_9TELE|nr:Solute carrier organic anion transporter family member 2B1 [Liparis tanakae]
MTHQIKLTHQDLRWVGAWWLGFLVASGLLFLTALPYLFFPRSMTRESEDDEDNVVESGPDGKQQQTDPVQEVSLLRFLKSFPCIALRTLRSPVYLLVVLAQVNLAALLSGLATFMAKFIERQFSQTVSLSIMMIGGVCIPLAVLGTVLGGVLMRRMNLSVSGAAKLCTAAILLCSLSSMPLLFIGCPTQRISGVFPPRSPCHAGCIAIETGSNNDFTVRNSNYTGCRCVGGLGSASPGTCGSGCSGLLLPFVALLGLTSFVASFSQTPSYMMILRTVPTEDKSFAVGVQFMLFRVLGESPSAA